MPDWIVVAPVLFPLLGAIVFPRIALRTFGEIRARLPLVYLALEILLILLTLAAEPDPFVLSSWELGSFVLGYQVDEIALVVLLAMAVPLFALWLVAPPPTPFKPSDALIMSAAMLLVVSSGFQAIYFAWVLLDLAILAWRLGREHEGPLALRGFAVAQIGGLLLMGGDVLNGTGHPDLGPVLLTLAFWVRLGLFPFHWVLPQRRLDADEAWIVRVIPLLAGANLWLHWWSLQLQPPAELIAALAAGALIASTVWTWRGGYSSDAATAAAAQAMACVPIAIAYAGAAGAALAFWMTLAVALAMALFEAVRRSGLSRSNPWAVFGWTAAILSLAQLPLTPAFLGRLALYVALWEKNAWLALWVTSATTLLVLLPLWARRPGVDEPESIRSERKGYGGIGMLVLIGAVLSLTPMPIAAVITPHLSESSQAALLLAIMTDDLPGVLAGLLYLLGPVLLAVLFRSLARGTLARDESLSQPTGGFLDLEWLGSAVAVVGYATGRAARDLSSIAEENPIIWILLIALWLAIFVLIPR